MTIGAAHAAALDVVDEVFGGAIRLGRACLDVLPSATPHPVQQIEVRPSNPKACPVVIHADDKQIDLLLGPLETLREIYARQPQKRLAELRACLEGVLEGRYEEVVERNGRKLTGRFRDGPAPYVHRGSNFGPPRVTTFEPY